MQYQIVSAESAADLEEQVQRKLNEGWALQGGVAIDKNGLHQAMSSQFTYEQELRLQMRRMQNS